MQVGNFSAPAFIWMDCLCVCVCFTGTLQLRKGNNLFGLQRAVNRESSRQSKKGKEQDNETGRAGNKKAAEGMQSPNRSNDRATKFVEGTVGRQKWFESEQGYHRESRARARTVGKSGSVCREKASVHRREAHRQSQMAERLGWGSRLD